MILNGHNTELVRFAAKHNNPYLNNHCDVLQVGPNGTLATDGFLLVAVSSLDAEKIEPPLLIEASTLPTEPEIYGGESFDATALSLFGTKLENRKPIDLSYVTKGIEFPDATVNIRASLLLRVALAALKFADGKDAVVKMEVTGQQTTPIRMTTENKETGQKWLGLLMQSTEKAKLFEFLKVEHLTNNSAIAAEAEEFEAAIRAAELLGVK